MQLLHFYVYWHIARQQLSILSVVSACVSYATSEFKYILICDQCFAAYLIENIKALENKYRFACADIDASYISTYRSP